MDRMLRNPAGFIMAGLLFLPFLAYALEKVDVFLFCVMLGLSLYACFLILNFELGFLLLILVRSSLDFIREMGPVNVSAMVTVGIIVLCIFYILYRRVNVFKYEQTLPFLIFLIASCVSLLVTYDRAASFQDIIRLVSIFCVYLIVRSMCDTPVKIKRMLLTLLLSTLFPVGMAYYQHFTGTGISTDFEHGRLLGTFSHPNSFSSYLLVVMIFCIPQLLEKKPIFPKWFLRPYVFLVSIIFLFTYSRGAWIVCVLALILMGFLRYKKLLLLAPVALIGVILFVPSVRERWTYEEQSATFKRPSSMDWRKETWRSTSPLIEKRPFFGNGLTMVEFNLGYEAHNDYIRLLAEIGALGLAAYMFLMLGLLRGVFLDYKKASNDFEKSVALAALAVVVGLLVRSFADNSLRGTAVMIYLWLFVACSRSLIACSKTPLPAVRKV